jgi:putative membrane protein
LKADIAAARDHPLPAQARTITDRLIALTRHHPATAKGRSVLMDTRDDVMDASGLLLLAEQQLMTPLDHEARLAILSASRRVSVVTAVSPRAIVDIGYVVFEALRLVRTLATLYGSRPGWIGLLRLSRDVVAHLAVTGSIAVGDGIIQQILGHGLASKLSARLGEGVINGMMTARIGIAAMDLCRPMPFHALKRPGLTDFITALSAVSKPADP